MTTSSAGRSVWSWIPSLYFAQGLPYVIVMTLSVILYKDHGISNTDITFYTSWLYLPFVIKPLWAPLVDMNGKKRGWIVVTELVIGALFAAVALTIPASDFFRWSLACFWLLAFAAATHDISVDGFYMLALEKHQQAAYVGFRSLFYRCAMLTGQGGLVWLAGHTADLSGSVEKGWMLVFGLLAAMFLVVAVWHQFGLPKPDSDHAQRHGDNWWHSFVAVFALYFRKPQFALAIAFMLLYRFGEAQLVKVAPLFLKDSIANGGLALSTEQVGLIYGMAGMAALTTGGITGGAAISRWGLKACLWPMAIAINLPHLVYVYLAWIQPQHTGIIGISVAIEQFGYGFGFAAYLLYLMMFSDGEHKTAHYAICTGFMALSMMIPGLFSGWLQAQLGYTGFFLWICVAALVTFIVCAMIRIDPQFGKKDAQQAQT